MAEAKFSSSPQVLGSQALAASVPASGVWTEYLQVPSPSVSQDVVSNWTQAFFPSLAPASTAAAAVAHSSAVWEAQELT